MCKQMFTYPANVCSFQGNLDGDTICRSWQHLLYIFILILDDRTVIANSDRTMIVNWQGVQVCDWGQRGGALRLCVATSLPGLPHNIFNRQITFGLPILHKCTPSIFHPPGSRLGGERRSLARGDDRRWVRHVSQWLGNPPVQWSRPSQQVSSFSV